MAEALVIRHAQASFGAADYDVLSDLGHVQSEALGRALAVQGVRPQRWIMGAQRRHRETLEGIARGLGADPTPEIHEGLNEFDFKGLLDARFRGGEPPIGMHDDRKTHFRTLRETVLAWQAGEIDAPPESWEAFSGRVAEARAMIMQGDGPVLAVSSGGAISQMIAATLGAETQIELQLQMRNCAVNRFVYSPRSVFLHSFNETPHITAETENLLTYS